MAAALADLGRVALDVVLAVGPMVSSEHVAKTQHVMQMRHSRLESFREDVRDLLDERLDSSQNLTLKSTLLFGFVTAILVEGFPPQKMKSEMCVDVFLFLVSWGIALLFQSMTFAVLYQRGMMTVGHRHLRELQRIGSKQAEEEITQGPQTFADSLQSRWRARNRRREERVATEWGLATVGRAVVGLVARLFALPPGPPGFKQPSCQCSDEEREEFCSLNGSDGEDLEHFPSEGVLSLDYLTLELKGRKSSKSPVKDTSQAADRIASPREEQLHRPKELVHVTELSKMPEVKALELYENQAHDTVFGGSLFTLMSLGFCIMYHIQLRLEVYEDHPMAWFARLGIFLPPFIVAAFTIFIKPFPEKHHYRVMVEDMEDYRNPTRIRPATQCVVLFGALISCTSLAFALQLHVPPLATQPKRPVPVLRVTEWTVDRWPLFFHPKGLTASEAQDALIVTSDFAVARFQLQDGVAQLAEERRLRGYELGDATVMNSSILLAGQRELYYLSFGTDEADLRGLGLPSAVVGEGTEVPQGLAFWPQQNLLFLAPPRGGIVASRMADPNHSLGIDFRLPMQEAVFGLSVDQDEDLLYVLLQQELRVFDLGDRPGSLLRSFRLPQEENNTWSGLACAGRRLFAVTHSPAKLLHLQLPGTGRQCSLRNCQEEMMS